MIFFNRVFWLTTVLLMLSSHILASTDSDVAFIAEARKPPIGVIFEVAENDEASLKLALERIDQYSATLKLAIPSIKLAIVTHGTEQFALLTKNNKLFQGAHNKVQALIKNNVPVHVCGTHASWFSLTAKDFPDYVDVTKSGPAKIIEYQRKGYALVKIDL